LTPRLRSTSEMTPWNWPNSIKHRSNSETTPWSGFLLMLDSQNSCKMSFKCIAFGNNVNQLNIKFCADNFGDYHLLIVMVSISWLIDMFHGAFMACWHCVSPSNHPHYQFSRSQFGVHVDLHEYDLLVLRHSPNHRIYIFSAISYAESWCRELTWLMTTQPRSQGLVRFLSARWSLARPWSRNWILDLWLIEVFLFIF